MKRKRAEWTRFERVTPTVNPKADPLWRAAMERHKDGSIMFQNSRYTVLVYPLMWPGSETPGTWLSIRNNDRSAHHDWRDLQRIKNEIVGPEAEAVEIYPAESRLVDTSNQFHLWVLPPGTRTPVGFPERMVAETGVEIGAVQRPWTRDARPADLSNPTMDELLDTLSKMKGV